MSSEPLVCNILKTLECSICLSTIRNPRRLACEHSYCKECLDDLLKFEASGACTIKCPKNCTKKTRISKEKTTNDLGIDYMMKGILDVIDTEQGKRLQKPTCSKPGCYKDITSYCSPCNSFLCGSCVCRHPDRKKYINVVYNTEDGKFEGLCKEHSSNAKWMCDNQFICVYCVHRNHAGHYCKPVERVAKVLREKLLKGIQEIDEMPKILEKSLLNTRFEVLSAKRLLRETLQHRKLVSLLKYLQNLDHEERRIYSACQHITLSHVKQYEFTDYRKLYQELAPLGDILLSAHSEKIEMHVSSKKPRIREETISLSDFNFNANQPLGRIDVQMSGDHNIDGGNSSFKCLLPDLDAQSKEVKLNIFNAINSWFQNTSQALIKECQVGDSDLENENGNSFSRLQSSYRSYMANLVKETKPKLLTSRSFAAWVIQCWWRNIREQRRVKVQNDAACIIQKAWKGYKEQNVSRCAYPIPKRRKLK